MSSAISVAEQIGGSSVPAKAKLPIDRRAKDALWHLAGLWARVMYVLIILNIILAALWIPIWFCGMILLAGAGAHR